MFSSKSHQELEGMEMNSLNELKLPPAEECIYTSCYCEENVWKLCEYVRKNQPDLLPECYAVFISNRSQSVPLWCQKSGNEDSMCIWDYHVIFLYCCSHDAGTIVYDLDSTLPFSIPMEKYAPLTFRHDTHLQACYHRKFRVVPAEDFLNVFASDRSRMKREDGTWIKSPPPYPCISTRESTNNISEFISMDPNVGIGEVMSLQRFLERFL